MAETPAPRAPRADARRNRDRLLAAATAHLSRDPQASMAQLAEVGGLTRTTLYRHFPTREALLGALLDAAIADAEAALGVVLECHGNDAARVVDGLARVILEAGDRYAFLRSHRAGLDGQVPVGDARDALGRWLAAAREDGRVKDAHPVAWQRRAILGLAGVATEALHDGELTETQAYHALRAALGALLLTGRSASS